MLLRKLPVGTALIFIEYFRIVFGRILLGKNKLLIIGKVPNLASL